ncbi:M15 family metallopeptidase [Tepidiforma sp.]|uniref:M15 family metallopeptidase n=1 Tax=Tepidiforma sp. TaxID=2682230 RepID=UPI002ADD4CD6|nr:M15 family metallopeptidase [Tepidiforma sp.]
MADSRTRRAAPTRRRETVGAKRGGSAWAPRFAAALITLVLAVVVFVAVAADSARSPGPNPGGAPDGQGTPAETATATTPAGEPSPTAPPPTATPTAGPDGTVVVTCGDILAPVDKVHRLPADCVPPDLVQLPASASAGGAQYLRREAADALLAMFDAAREDGFELRVNSAYRSYETQAATYNYWVQVNGQAYADRTSARPGHSEHQLGTAADVGARGLFLEDFAGTPEADWLAENAWKFGFVVSYPDGKEHITGYAYEPWHVRYVGRDVAEAVHRSGLTLREYLLQR